MFKEIIGKHENKDEEEALWKIMKQIFKKTK